jgi:hypothetical protein
MTTSDEMYDRWSHAVKNYVGNELFRYVQLINRDSDIEYGSSIQKVVCKQCSIPTQNQQEYWNIRGCDEVVQVLRRKRQSVTTCFKLRFASK